jgi:MFS family permease
MSHATVLAASGAEQREHPYSWIIVGVATVCLTLGFGANIIVSVFMKPFEDEFGWLRAETSMAYTMNAVGAAFGGLFWGRLSDLVGPRRIGLFGAITLATGMIALRWQSQLWSLYLLSFVIGAFGFASLFAPMVALTGRWFTARKGLAIGIVTAGGALGQGLIPYIAGSIITTAGWRDAALWLGIGYFVILLPLVVLLRPPPAAVDGVSNNTESSNENLWGISHRITIPWLASPACSAASAWQYRWCIWCRSALAPAAVHRRPQDCFCPQ